MASSSDLLVIPSEQMETMLSTDSNSAESTDKASNIFGPMNMKDMPVSMDHLPVNYSNYHPCE